MLLMPWLISIFFLSTPWASAHTQLEWDWIRDLRESGVRGELVEITEADWNAQLPQYKYFFMPSSTLGRVKGVGLWRNLTPQFLLALKQIQRATPVHLVFSADKTSQSPAFRAAIYRLSLM